MTRLLGERAWLLARIADEVGLQRVRRRLARRAATASKPLASSPTSAPCAQRRARSDQAAARPTARAATRSPTWLDRGRTDRPRRCLSQGVLHQGGRRAGDGSPPRPPSRRMPDIASVLLAEAERLGRVLDHASACALVDRHDGAAAARPRHHPALRRGQATARGTRLRRPDRRHPPPAGKRARAPPGCSTSSMAASTTCWSTRRRTPIPTSGR